MLFGPTKIMQIYSRPSQASPPKNILFAFAISFWIFDILLPILVFIYACKLYLGLMFV